uniref:Ribosomal protein L23 n=1 Tax=Drosera indica TaxID=16680 RepID=A0A411K3B8_9CARY|nr:ribosomal protein L23 [Drosera indica]QBC71823.1 ribosomal protein L23 [Drosera indica]
MKTYPPWPWPYPPLLAYLPWAYKTNRLHFVFNIYPLKHKRKSTFKKIYQFTYNVEPGLTKPEIKNWVELFMGIKVIAINSHRLPKKGRRMGHTMHSKRIIISFDRNTINLIMLLELIKTYLIEKYLEYLMLEYLMKENNSNKNT